MDCNQWLPPVAPRWVSPVARRTVTVTVTITPPIPEDSQQQQGVVVDRTERVDAAGLERRPDPDPHERPKSWRTPFTAAWALALRA